MWSLLSRVGQAIGLVSSEPDVDEDAIAAILDAPDPTEEDIQKPLNDLGTEAGVVCQHRVGKVTGLFDMHGFIADEDGDNGQLYFQRRDSPQELKVGDHVTYLVFRRGEGSGWVVRKVLSVDNDSWDKREGEEEDNYEDNGVREEFETAYKHVIVQVTGREGRVVLAENLQFSLDSVKIDFIPVEGDWVMLQSLVQTERRADMLLEVDRVVPLRTQTLEGKVSHYNEQVRQGIIDSAVVFSLEVCQPGYIPRTGDKVKVECLESAQGALTWRALLVVPTVHREVETLHNPQELATLLENKHDVVISDDTNFGLVTVAADKQLTVNIANKSETSVNLSKVSFSSKDSQFSLVSPRWNKVLEIPPNKDVDFVFNLKSRFIGRSTELVRFEFDGFTIGRQLVVDVQDASVASSLVPQRGGSTRVKKELITAEKLQATRDGFVLPGRRPIRPAHFVPVQLGMWNIPEKLTRVVAAEGLSRRQEDLKARLMDEYRFLNEPLNEAKYEMRWHLLIHLEELEHSFNISQYNTNGSFRRVEDYLSLEIPGLAERRPSLIVGDKVIAQPTWQDDNSSGWGSGSLQAVRKFEGHIHKVLGNEILLKFHPTFHDSCCGVYALAFEGNRTSFRREHQAVHLAYSNLKARWLFPSCVQYKTSQIKIREEEDYDVKDNENLTNVNETVNTNSEDNGSGDLKNGRHNQQEELNSSVGVTNLEAAFKNLKINDDKNSPNNKQKKSKNNGEKISIDDLERLEKGKDNILESAANALSTSNESENGDKRSKRSDKKSKNKVVDMLKNKTTESEVQQKHSSPRFSVAARILQNGNGPVVEKSPKEVKNMLKQLASLSSTECKPAANKEMKTLEEIEKSLLNGGSDVLNGINPLNENNSLETKEKLENSAFSTFLKSNNLATKSKQTDSFIENEKGQIDEAGKESKPSNKATKNDINENSQAQRRNRDNIKWNSNGQLKQGKVNVAKVRNSDPRSKKITWFNPLLNHYQKEAIRNILKGEARPLPFVIFGPPGTGKTITLVEAVLQIYHCLPNSRLLIGTPSNSSADLVSERLLDSGLLQPGDLLRLVGFHYSELGKVSDKLKPYCGMADVKARDDYQDPQSNPEGVVNISRHAIGRHRITVGTCNTLGILYQMGFPKGHFTHILLDEAGQATEPEILIPLAFLHETEGQCVLAGDPLQLGPVVMSKVADSLGLGESLLSRLLLTTPYRRDITGYPSSGGYNPHLVTRLVYNYRSLPEILALPNNMFYDGDLLPRLSAYLSEEAQLLKALAADLPTREHGQGPPSLVFHGVRGTNCQAVDSPSWHNPHEAVQATLYLQTLYSAGLTPEQCGIITPYQAQVLKIKQMLQNLGVPQPKVGSVEEFQGQERMAIILSTVRSSPRLIEADLRHTVGFIASPRRLNVAITRARALLIIIGNPHLLARDQYWRSVLEYSVHNEGYTGCDRPNLNTDPIH